MFQHEINNQIQNESNNSIIQLMNDYLDDKIVQEENSSYLNYSSCNSSQDYKFIQWNKFPACNIHKQEKLKYVCLEEQCRNKTAFCGDCIFEDHQQHQVQRINEFLQKLENSIDNLKNNNPFQYINQQLRTIQEIVNENLKTIRQIVKTHADQNDAPNPSMEDFRQNLMQLKNSNGASDFAFNLNQLRNQYIQMVRSQNSEYKVKTNDLLKNLSNIIEDLKQNLENSFSNHIQSVSNFFSQYKILQNNQQITNEEFFTSYNKIKSIQPQIDYDKKSNQSLLPQKQQYQYNYTQQFENSKYLKQFKDKKLANDIYQQTNQIIYDDDDFTSDEDQTSPNRQQQNQLEIQIEQLNAQYQFYQENILNFDSNDSYQSTQMILKIAHQINQKNDQLNKLKQFE